MAVERLTFEMNAVGNAVPEMKRVQQQLANVSTGMGRAASASRTYNAAQQTVGRSSRGLVGGLGLVGLQIQDVAVQASMGTSALRIFTMQGPQILSIFGPVGMILGAVAGVAGGLAAAYFTAGEEASTFSERQDRLNGIMSDYKRVAEIARMETADLTAKYGDMADEVREAAQNLMRLRTIQAGAILREQISGLGDVIDEFAGTDFGFGTPTSVAMENVKELFGVTSGVAREIQGVFRELGQATTFEEQTAALDNIRQMTEDLGVEQLPRDLVDALVASEEFKISAAEMTQLLATLGESGSTSVRRITRELTDAEKKMQSVSDTMQSSFEDGFMAITEGTKTMKDAFRSMARDIIAQLYRVYVVQQIVGGFDAKTKTGTGIVGTIAGALFKAQGGAVSANRPYIVGEQGPEMLVPSTSGRVIPNNQLGGGGGAGEQIVINYNFQGGVTEADLGRALPLLVERTKREVVDAVQRGGSVARVFR